jgi:hypothetical protein
MCRRRRSRPTFRRSTRRCRGTSRWARPWTPATCRAPHAQLLTMHFNSITSGNDFKWSSTEPSLGSYNWTNADAEAGEAVCHDMKIRGHNLVWANGSQVPSYAFGDGTNSAANQATVTANIQEHIKTEVQHFGTEVYAWDVVNEPIDPTQSDCLVHGPFYNVLGASYIDIAFEAARQYAPPGTKLFLNEYSTADPTMLACLVKVVQGMQSRGGTDRRDRAREPQQHQLSVDKCDQDGDRHGCVPASPRSAGDRAGRERVQRRRFGIELRQQYSSGGAGRAGLALQPVLQPVPRGEPQVERRDPLGHGRRRHVARQLPGHPHGLPAAVRHAVCRPSPRTGASSIRMATGSRATG